MKCDELHEKIQITNDPRMVYVKEDVDAAIAELKQTIDKLVGVKKSAEQILQNLIDCGLIKEWYFNGKFNVVLKADDPHLEIAELKQKLDKAIAERDSNQVCIDALKQKLENVQASMYADVVDSNMENRRLKRALYKACDNWAVCEMDYWRKCLEHYEDYFNVRTDEDLTEEKCERMIDSWRKVAHNCRAKAEEYK